MYAQVTYIEVPMNQIGLLRAVIEEQYLPTVRSRPGFRAGYLLEQVDDPDIAQLVLFWDDHYAVENFNRTGALQASIQGLAVEIPGLSVKREGFIVRVATRAMPAEAHA